MLSLKQLFKVLLIILVIDFMMALYLGCLTASLFTFDEIVLNPFKIFSWIGRNGFPKLGFLVWFGIMCVFSIVIYVGLFLSDQKSIDELGRKLKKTTKRQTYGDAHFLEPDEYRDAAIIKKPEDAKGPILGQLDDSGKRLIVGYTKKIMGNGHMCVFGQSGYGKSYTFTNNMVMQCKRRRESMIISDPDGGLERDLRGYLVNAGYVVRTLNLKDFTYSNGWDCLRSVADENPEKVVTKIQIFTQTCIENTFAGNGKQDIYFTGPLELLRALVMRVWFDDDMFPPEKKTLKTVVSLLNQPDIEEFLAKLFDESTMSTEDQKRCLGPWRTFLSTSKNLKGNLIANLGSMLGVVMDSNALSTLLSTDEIDLELPGDQPCAYFCQFPDMHSSYKFVVSLFFSMVMQCLADKADRAPKGQLRVPVNFILDEFAAIGRLPDWDNKLSVVRKRHINIIMIFQNITQLQNNYQDAWVTIMSNSDIWMSLAVNDEYTASVLQKRIGTTTVEVQTESKSTDESILGALLNSRKSSGEGRRDLMTVDEIMKMDPNTALILIAHKNPIIAVKYPYINHPDAYLVSTPDPLGDLPQLFDVEGREARNEKEERFLASYYQKHPDELVPKEELRPPDAASTKAAAKEYITLGKNKVKKAIHKLRTGEELEEFKNHEEINELEEIAIQHEGEEDASSIYVDQSTGEVITPISEIDLEDDDEEEEEEKEPEGPCSVSSNDEMSWDDLDAIFAEEGDGEVKQESEPEPELKEKEPPVPVVVSSGQPQMQQMGRPPMKASRPPAISRN